jgi:opacity protein-like surface antigen
MLDAAMSITRTLVVGLLLTVVAPGAARADTLIVPFVGVNFGGDSGSEFFEAADASRFNWGASLAWMGAGVFGVEGDIGYSPDFFGKTDAGGSSVLTVTGNLLLGVPFGGQSGFGVRPYALVGIGMVRPDGDAFAGEEVFGENRISWDFGGGLMIFFATHVGIRADIRYFRTFEAVDFLDIEASDTAGNLDFTRGSVGFVLRF